MVEPKPKVLLVLQDSSTNPNGLVYDCLGYTPVDLNNLSEYECIGTWQKIDKGTVILELTTTVEARQDVLINLLKGIREARIKEFGSEGIYARYPTGVDTSGVKEHKSTVRISKPSAEPERNISAEFSSLKDKLRRK